MRVDLFDFELPPERIALRPARPRDTARLLLLDGPRTADHVVSDLPSLLRPGDCLVFNDTRVIPAQLEGRRGDAQIGATLHKRQGPRSWAAFVRNARRVRIGETIDFGAGVAAVANVAGRRRIAVARICGRRAGRASSRTRRADAAAALYSRQA